MEILVNEKGKQARPDHTILPACLTHMRWEALLVIIPANPKIALSKIYFFVLLVPARHVTH